MTEEDRARLLARKAQIDARLKAFDARQQKRKRADDTRRKIIAGALALEHADSNPDSEFAAIINRLAHRYVIRPMDRALFDLPPLEPDGGNIREEEQEAKAENGIG